MSNGSTRQRVVLVVLDGWGYRREREGNAIALASTPAWHRLWASSPRTLLDASGLAVGLPEGQMGNSEVGHLNLGAGRVVTQDLVRISQSIQSGEFFSDPAAGRLCASLRQTGGTLHLVGLIGPGGVHALDRTCSPASSSACASGCRASPSMACSTAATRRRPWARKWSGRCCSTCGGSPGRGWTSPAHRPLLRHGPRPALGAHPAGLRRDGARRRHAGRHPVLAVQAAYQRGETDEFIRPPVHRRGTAARWRRCATATR